MKFHHYILFITFLFLGYSCTDEIATNLNGPKKGLPATVSFSFSTLSNELMTRVISSEADEKKIHNLYILIFDNNGQRTSGHFFDAKELANNALTLFTKSGRKHVYGIANIDLRMMSMGQEISDIETGQTDKKLLDAVASEKELLEINSKLLHSTTERLDNFLMSGYIEDENGKIADVDIFEGDNKALGTIKLNRVDAKISFEIQTPDSVTFIAKDWRVYNVPKKVSLFPGEDKSHFTDQNDYFNTDWHNFEGEGDLKGKTFGFYVLENIHSFKALIPSGLESSVQYNYRELQEKTPVTGKPNQTVENGAFIYAPDQATYVKLRGILIYRDQVKNMDILADVVYTIHLGYRKKGDVGDANDYDAIRNSHYRYKITILSVNNIIQEVRENIENQPGAEGIVTEGNTTFSFDAHYETKIIGFSTSTISDDLDWYVRTPFSDGFAKDNPKDKDWILFGLNNRSDNQYYDETFIKFPGETNRFTGVGLNDFNTVENRSKLLTVDQLVALLKESKNNYLDKKNDHLFDSNGNIRFTAFINENYYDQNPENTSDKPVDQWKRFVNQPERIMNIISKKDYSPDGNSIMTESVISFRQASIQTMYNTELSVDKLKTAWGSEMIQDKTKYSFGDAAKSPTDTRDGRKNCIEMWGINGNPDWKTYINPSDGKLNENYQNAQFACLRLNRDNNGNGKIDKEEIRWYLSSIDQLTDLWIGENSFDPDARLYDLSEWVISEQWYVSSSFSSENNPTVLWSAEGSSTGPQSLKVEKNKLHYRSVRNLGIPAGSDEKPQDFASYDAEKGIISLEGLNYKSIRENPTTTELPEHHEREAVNKPYRKFKVQKGARCIGKSWIEIRDLINSGQSPAKDLPEEGWRVPNQRELALMRSRIGNDGNWVCANHMSRTRFSYNPVNGTRYGFSVLQNNGNLYLINNDGERGGVRCVRDLE